MNYFKKAIEKILSLMGYRLKRLEDKTAPSEVHFHNFLNLSLAYEHRLNESNPDFPVLPNQNRPKLLGRLWGTPPSEAYFILQALVRSARVAGDICEFGVAQGETSALIANEIAAFEDKTLHLFDSFQGFPRPTEKDQLKDDVLLLGNMEAYTGAMSSPEEMVISRLKAISFPGHRYVVHKGFFEDVVRKDTNLPKKVAFAYVDFDLYEPIKLALKFLHSVTARGAIVMIDDYDFFSTGAKTAVDEFLAEENANAQTYECLIPDVKYGHFALLQRVA